MVRRIAGQYAPRRADLEDLVQAGMLGLLLAMRRYDPARGTSFQAFANKYIIGAICDALRDGALCRLPEWLPPRYRAVGAAAASLHQELGRAPTVAEIGAWLHLRESSVLKIRRTYKAVRVYPAGDLLRDGSTTLPNRVVRRSARAWRQRIDEQHLAGQLLIEERIAFHDLLLQLDELQKKVVYCVFYMDFTQTQAARRLGMSQRRVSRVLARAVQRLALLLRAGEHDARRSEDRHKSDVVQFAAHWSKRWHSHGLASQRSARKQRRTG